MKRRGRPGQVGEPGGAARRTWGGWLRLGLLLAVGLVLLAVVEPLQVTSGSMRPTLEVGDHIVIDKLTGRWRAPAVGDLVVFREPGGGDLAVKRVVGVAGASVALEDGVLHIDGIPQPEPELDHRGVDSVYFGPVTVPVGAVFVMGDNRGESLDSRTYGPIAVADLIGRVVLSL
jgi:signal peptidase I